MSLFALSSLLRASSRSNGSLACGMKMPTFIKESPAPLAYISIEHNPATSGDPITCNQRPMSSGRCRFLCSQLGQRATYLLFPISIKRQPLIATAVSDIGEPPLTS